MLTAIIPASGNLLDISLGSSAVFQMKTQRWRGGIAGSASSEVTARVSEAPPLHLRRRL